MSSALERLEEKEYYTYADYLEWDQDVRAEIIRGVMYMMSSPRTLHQRISMRLSQRIAQFLEGKTCEVFAAPFGVRLFPREDKQDNTVVEPDIVVVCDPAKLDEWGCNGAPDLVIEIISPSTSRKDQLIKFDAYLQAGVREFWTVFPEDKGILAYMLDNGRYSARSYGVNEPDDPEDEWIPDIIPVAVLPGLEIDLNAIFR